MKKIIHSIPDNIQAGMKLIYSVANVRRRQLERLAGAFSAADRYKKRTMVFCLTLFLLLLIFAQIPLPPLDKQREYSTVILDDQGKILRVFLNRDEQWYLPPENTRRIPDKLKACVLEYEDKFFYLHPGVNPVALVRALFQNIVGKQVVSGASTLTMQVVRILKKKPRTVWNKLGEILQAVKLETCYSKEHIFKLYLNNAPYGGNVIGYEAASLRYFNKVPDELTWAQAATLAVLPNAPGLISVDVNNRALREKRNKLLKKLLTRKTIDEESYKLACSEPLPAQSVDFPLKVPHLAQSIINTYQPRTRLIRTYIDAALQEKIENVVASHKLYLNSLGIANCAVIVAETASGKVKVYIGSEDFFDHEHNGQVDGVMATRSTGSILKPFLYALALDAGMLLPQTMIADIPVHFGSFSPHNADLSYSGLVSVSRALQGSLNVPAAIILQKYGLKDFYFFLSSAGLTSLVRFPEDYGLTLVLGGAEGRLLELAALYRGLGRYGIFEPLKLYETGKKGRGAPYNLISRGASYLTLEMLRELKRPGTELWWEFFSSSWPLAWKTGTSFGNRDAWAIGVSPQWTIGVWVGNFTGKENTNLKSFQSSAPLLFNVFNALDKDVRLKWFEKPLDDLELVKICLDTGYIAGADCPHTGFVPAPQMARALTVCPYHRAYYVSKDEKYEVCSRCWEPGMYKRVVKLVYPPNVIQYLREQGYIIDTIPLHNPNCPAGKSNSPLFIIYPQDNSRLLIPRDLDGKYQKVTFKAAHREADQLIYWYIDQDYEGMTKNEHTLLVDGVSLGWHKLEIIDSYGYRESINFFVDYTAP